MTRNQAIRISRPPVRAVTPNKEFRRESVSEFVAYFYEFVRDDVAMVQLLDRALKERYLSGGTSS